MLINVGSRTVLLELTNKCYTGCTADYCYKKITVSTKGQHIPFEVVIKRIDWIKKFVKCNTINILGGEPLLHPNFKQICSYIIQQGFSLDIITSGKISKIPYEIQNLEYLLELYEQGKINIELSYHYGRNQEAFKLIRNKFIDLYWNRRAELKKKGLYSDKNYDHFSTVVITGGMKRKEFDLFVATVLADNGWAGSENKYLDQMWVEYTKHFYTNIQSFAYGIASTDDWKLFRQSIRFVGAKDLFDLKGNFYLSLPEGGSCDAANATIKDGEIMIGSMHIRADGGVTFPMPQCIDMPNPMANVDVHTTETQIHSALSRSLNQVRKHVYMHNRIKAKDNCDENGNEKECKACPFGEMCTGCWMAKRPWQKD